MSSLESDLSALQAGRIDPVPAYIGQEEAEASENKTPPLYTEREEGQDELQAIIAALAIPQHQGQVDPAIVREIIRRQKGLSNAPKGRESGMRDLPDPDFSTWLAIIVKSFFDAISRGDTAVVKLFIDNNLVTANTRLAGKTPLLAAVTSKRIGMVEQLIQAGAEPDAYGVETISRTPHIPSVHRTPLQLAAAIGNLPLVKLLMETYHCDDALIAPDGQIALRLAATNGHREVVDYLPIRRGGSFLRWKTANTIAIYRAKRALMKIYKIIKFLVWDVEKFILWTAPKECIVKPLYKSCVWCSENRKLFGPWCKRQIQELPGRVKRFGKQLWTGIKPIPKKVWNTMKAIPNKVAKGLQKFRIFITKTIPDALKKFGVYLWNLLTKRIPRAIAIVAKWVADGVYQSAELLRAVILKTLSLLHTALAAIISFFRRLTLNDIWNGFVDLLRFIFITMPRKLWYWLCATGRMSYRLMQTLFGSVGEGIWWIGYGILWLVTYVPRRLWEVVQAMAESLGKAFHELAVWVNPKA